MSPNPLAVEHYQLGIDLSKNKNWKEAIKEFNTAIKLDQEFIEAMYALGICYEYNDSGVHYGPGWKSLNVIDLYERILKINPKYSPALTQWGIILSLEGKHGEAIAKYLLAIQSEPSNSQAHLNLGTEYERQGSMDFAATEYEQAIRLDSKNPYAHYDLGNICFKQGHIADAIDEYERAIFLKPDYLEAHSNLSLAFAELEEYDRAIKIIQQAIQIFPNYAKGYFLLGILYLKKGDRIKAMDEYKILHNLDSTMAEKLLELLSPSS